MLVNNYVNQGPFRDKNYKTIEHSGNRYVYIDGDVVLDGQISKIERQRHILK